jgi:hypothetical protein
MRREAELTMRQSPMSREAGQSKQEAPYLVAEVLRVTSDTLPGVDSAGYEAALPLELLKLASLKASSSEVTRELRDLQEIYVDLCSLGAAPWKEPELFLALYALVESFNAPEALILRVIRFHLLRDLEPPREWRGQYLRSPVMRGKLYRFVNDSSTPIDLPKLRRGGPVLVPVVPGLYFDMLSSELYPKSNIPLSNELCTKVEASLDMIGHFSSTLLDDILRTVAVFALVGDMGRPGFSARTKYYGGIFLNPLYERGDSLAETIIHEYLHLKLWLLWTFEPVCSDKVSAVEITSPITGQRRSIDVMLQAYLIYAQCIEFYLWADLVKAGGNAEWNKDRLNHLLDRTPILRDVLASAVVEEKSAVQMIDAIEAGLRSRIAA